MFNLNLNWNSIADFSANFDPVAFEKELAAIANVATIAAVNSPAVVNAPPVDPAAVQQVVNQVVQAVAPVVAPSVPATLLTKLEKISADEVLNNPQVKSSPSGSTVPSTVVDTITSSIASTFKNDVQKDAGLISAIKDAAQQPGTTATTTAKPDSVNMPYDTTKPSTSVNMPYDTTKPSTTVNLGTTTSTATAAANVQTTQNFTGRGISNDPLMADGKAFTGNRNGIEYKNGVAVNATRADILQADREANMKAEAEARAKSNPLYDFGNRPTAPQPDENYIYYYSWIGGVNSGEWRLYRAPNDEVNRAKYLGRSIGGPTQATGDSAVGANALQNQPTVTPGGVISNPGAGNSVPGPGTGSIPAPGATTGVTTSGVTTSGATPSGTLPSGVTTTPTTSTPFVPGSMTPTTTTAATTGVTQPLTGTGLSVYTILEDRFRKYGLSSLAGKIRDLAIDGATEDTITIQLQETPEYQLRFKANQERIKKGLSVLSPAEYLGVEDTYRQILRSYGLNQFDNDQYVSQFISNDVSPAELSNRVVTAVQRVRNADPAISTTLRDFYGIGNADLVAYVLDPNQQLPKIERQVAAAEIGAAARRQGLEAGVGVSEALAAQGISQAEAQKGYATIADILPTAEKLSQIYGGVEQKYGQAEAEQEVFNTLASAQRRRQRLTQREIASFSGTTGAARTALTSQTRGQFQNPERTGRPRQCIRPIVGATPFPRMNVRPATNYDRRVERCYEQQLLG